VSQRTAPRAEAAGDGGSPRSLLFVPADRPERFAKATASGADGVILDLEDAVADADKVMARQHVAAWLVEHAAMVRINASDTPWFDDDIAVVSATSARVFVPKVQSAAQAASVVERLPGNPIVVLLETAAGIVNAASICTTPGVSGVAFGSVDLGAELGVDPADRLAMSYARAAVVMAAAAAQLPAPLDGVCLELHDAATISDEARYAAAMGFGGKLCIHPRQIASVNAAFSPNVDDVAWARRVVAVGDTTGAAKLDGKMIDRPVVARAHRILDRVESVS
jgi:citrate lyase subunit beta / citryl-CoA lyase